jgi:hypothetical protein
VRNQDVHAYEIIVGQRIVHWSVSFVVLCVRISSSIQQQSHDLMIAGLSRTIEDSIPFSIFQFQGYKVEPKKHILKLYIKTLASYTHWVV